MKHHQTKSVTASHRGLDTGGRDARAA